MNKLFDDNIIENSEYPLADIIQDRAQDEFNKLVNSFTHAFNEKDIDNKENIIVILKKMEKLHNCFKFSLEIKNYYELILVVKYITDTLNYKNANLNWIDISKILPDMFSFVNFHDMFSDDFSGDISEWQYVLMKYNREAFFVRPEIKKLTENKFKFNINDFFK